MCNTQVGALTSSRMCRFARCTPLPVRMAVAGDPVEPGVVYIARSDLHLRVTAAVESGAVDYVLSIVEIAPMLNALVHGQAAVDGTAAGAS